jgi:hypothetical protein
MLPVNMFKVTQSLKRFFNMQSSSEEDARDVDVRLEHMEALGIVLRIAGFSEVTFYAEPHASRWRMPSFAETVSQEGIEFIEGAMSPLSPWRTLNGDIARHILPPVLRKLLSMVLSRPGITEVCVANSTLQASGC